MTKFALIPCLATSTASDCVKLFKAPLEDAYELNSSKPLSPPTIDPILTIDDLILFLRQYFKYDWVIKKTEKKFVSKVFFKSFSLIFNNFSLCLTPALFTKPEIGLLFLIESFKIFFIMFLFLTSP